VPFEQGIRTNHKKKNKQYQAQSLQLHDQIQVQDISNIPLRRNEQILQIWLAPYEDNAGNYVGAHSIFTIVATCKLGAITTSASNTSRRKYAHHK